MRRDRTARSAQGKLPLGLIVLKAGVDRPHEEIVAEVVHLVRDRIARSRRSRRPPSSTGCRRPDPQGATRHHAQDSHAESYTTPATIDDPAILDEIGAALHKIGYGGGRLELPEGILANL